MSVAGEWGPLNTPLPIVLLKRSDLSLNTLRMLRGKKSQQKTAIETCFSVVQIAEDWLLGLAG
jgi:hypothetical protein